MSMTITLSEQATTIVRSFLPAFDSPEAFVEAAIRGMASQELQTAIEDQEDQNRIEMLRQALAECEGEPRISLDLQSLKQALHREWEADRINPV
ncbi:MAG: hypothetical protein H7834_05910 [Magnetococcus sp. YQC-9]